MTFTMFSASPGNADVDNTWRQVFLGVMSVIEVFPCFDTHKYENGFSPNILALNFAPVIIESLVFLTAFIFFDFVLLFIFYRSSRACRRYNSIEGLQRTETRGKQWGLVIVTFLLMVIYLPLSTISVHVLVWSDELWAIPNPYTNATSLPPILPPLGPSNEYRDPLDFCWTTTMKRNEINLAPIFFALSTLVFIFVGDIVRSNRRLSLSLSFEVYYLVPHYSGPCHSTFSTQGGWVYRAWSSSNFR